MQRGDSIGPHAFADYAAHYDLLYQDKDYPGEAAFVAGLIGKFLERPAAQVRVADLACGTGRHAIEFARLGYRVEGSDLSAEMIGIAKQRCQDAGLTIQWHNEPFQRCAALGKRYDVALALFAAINYLTTYEDLAAAFRNISELLDREGLFIFDTWNGNAVLADYSPVRVKRVSDQGNEVLRTSRTTVDPVTQIARVQFHFMLLSGGTVLREFDETHEIRFFFPQEMVDLLKANHFEVVFRCPFKEPERAITAADWNLTYVVRKVAPPRFPE